jgi:UDPglucose 6-dehydrogenase
LVIAASESERHDVRGYDLDATAVAELRAGRLPISEPGLDALVAQHVEAGRLRFCERLDDAVTNADIVWITYDTPVDDDDNADVAFVRRAAEAAIPLLKPDAIVLVSSQVPVGFCRGLEERIREQRPDTRIAVVYSPENLQLGVALASFRHAERVVVGTRDAREDPRVRALFEPFAGELVWMVTESAEMTKHALNSYLAASLSFINEIAVLCEAVGADAEDVERALRLDKRIGARAYVHPGTGFAGGTLARDVGVLHALGTQLGQPVPLISSIAPSNAIAKDWLRRRLSALLQPPARIALLGLTYKPGTDTLRRSSAVEFARWMHSAGYTVSAHDPAVKALPPDLVAIMELHESVAEAAADAAAIVIGTEWPEYAELTPDQLTQGRSGQVLVLDPKRALNRSVRESASIAYAAVGLPARPRQPAGR